MGKWKRKAQKRQHSWDTEVEVLVLAEDVQFRLWDKRGLLEATKRKCRCWCDRLYFPQVVATISIIPHALLQFDFWHSSHWKVGCMALFPLSMSDIWGCFNPECAIYMKARAEASIIGSGASILLSGTDAQSFKSPLLKERSLTILSPPHYGRAKPHGEATCKCPSWQGLCWNSHPIRQTWE